MGSFTLAFLFFLSTWCLLFALAGKRACRRNGTPITAGAALVTFAGLFIYSAGGPGFKHLSDVEVHHSLGLLMITFGLALVWVWTQRAIDPMKRSLAHSEAITAAAVLICVIGGLTLNQISLPALGTITVGWLGGVLFSIIWILLVVAVVEVLFLIPFMVPMLALILGISVLTPFPVFQTVVGDALCGALVAFVVTRVIAFFVVGGGPVIQREETLLIGLLLACATLAMFLKGITVTGLMIPVIFIVFVLISLLLQNFDRSLILQPIQRD